MPSPFPGMDPYLEAPRRWGGVHAALTHLLREQLAPLVRPRFFVDSEEHVYLLLPDDPEVMMDRPDVAVVEVGAGVSAPAAPAGRIAAPVRVALPQPVPVRYARLIVRDTIEARVGAVIEVLSPANKRPGHPAQRRFAEKRERLLRADLHWIEIDLIRAGVRPPELADRVPYIAALHRAGAATLDLWPIGLRQPLPTIAVPLVAPLPDVPLDLQAALTTVYDRFGYDLIVDYGADPPPPPLSDAERAWVRSLMASR